MKGALFIGGTARARAAGRSGVAALEFAMVAPVMAFMIWGVWDTARALVAWEETAHAAQAIAQAAEKMSVTGQTYLIGPNTGKPISSLTDSQMQDAMSSIYAEMPFLNKGNDGGAFPGNFAVTLSGVSYIPLCPALATGVCLPQKPHTLWSSYLSQGGGHLITPPPLSTARYRLCGDLTAVAQFPNDSTQLLKMIDPTKTNGVQTVLIPQVVADVQYVFTPSFPLLGKSTFTFYASASFPAPLGGNDQPIVFDATHSTFGNTVENCADGGAV